MFATFVMPLELGAGEELPEPPSLEEGLEEGESASPPRATGGNGGSTTSFTSSDGAGAVAGGSTCPGTNPSREPGSAGNILYGCLGLLVEHVLPVIRFMQIYYIPYLPYCRN